MSLQILSMAAPSTGRILEIISHAAIRKQFELSQFEIKGHSHNFP